MGSDPHGRSPACGNTESGQRASSGIGNLQLRLNLGNSANVGRLWKDRIHHPGHPECEYPAEDTIDEHTSEVVHELLLSMFGDLLWQLDVDS
jgi:hypothetical protein